MHVGYHLVRQLDRLWNGETLSVMSRPGFELPTFLWSDWSLFFLPKFWSPNSKIVKTLCNSWSFWNFFVHVSLESAQKKFEWHESHADNDFMGFVLFRVAWQFQHFMKKHWKWTARLPLSSASCFSIAQGWFFIML